MEVVISILVTPALNTFILSGGKQSSTALARILAREMVSFLFGCRLRVAAAGVHLKFKFTLPQRPVYTYRTLDLN